MGSHTDPNDILTSVCEVSVPCNHLLRLVDTAQVFFLYFFRGSLFFLTCSFAFLLTDSHPCPQLARLSCLIYAPSHVVNCSSAHGFCFIALCFSASPMTADEFLFRVPHPLFVAHHALEDAVAREGNLSHLRSSIVTSGVQYAVPYPCRNPTPIRRIFHATNRVIPVNVL